VAELDVQPRPWPLARGRRREQRGDRPRLEQPQRAVAVVRPLDVLRCTEPALEPLTDLAQLLQPGQGQAAPFLAVCTVQHVVVGRDRAVDDGRAQSGSGVDDGLAPRAGERVGGEQHACDLRAGHALDDDRHPYRVVRDAGGLTVGARALAVQRVPAGADRREQLVGTFDCEERGVLAGEARVRQVLGGGAGTDGDRPAAETLVRGEDLGPRHLAAAVRLGRDAEPVWHAFAQPDQHGEADGLPARQFLLPRADRCQLEHVHPEHLLFNTLAMYLRDNTVAM
jgi:hypothetical protein